MGRITKVTGEFMGVRFEVKPTPIRFDKIKIDRDWETLQIHNQ